MVGSFTKAAAVEIAGRDINIPDRQVGTLHSLAYRSIDRPAVAEESLDEWNQRQPSYALSAGFKGEDAGVEVFRAGAPGDEVMAEVEVLRARLVPFDRWPIRAQAFHKTWSEWKDEKGVVDFTDMIELAIEKGGPAPGEPRVGFFDEVQDFTPLELKLVRMWGNHMDRIIVGGDDDQVLYGFKGATPDAFLNPEIPEEDKRFLTQSYRMPAAVHRVSQHWIKQVQHRQEKEFLPREEEGLVRMAPYRYKFPDPMIREIQEKISEGKDAMIIASCSYMIDPLKHRLREMGLPYHNPYRRSRGDWNPLNPGRGTSSAEKLLAYLVLDERLLGEASRLWTGNDVRAWTSVIKKKGVFRRGAVSAIRDLPDRELTYEEVAALFDDEMELEQCVEPSLDWFKRNLLSANRQPMTFPLAILNSQGIEALSAEPKVTVGTIHSVKGAQASVVYLMPDVSKMGMVEWNGQMGPDRRDGILRQMYVGMTRAKEELVICQPTSEFHVSPAKMLEGLDG
jgi:superfamily I DNA/RNA helicase